MHSANRSLVVIPREGFFWLAHLSGWFFYLLPTMTTAFVREAYGSQLLISDLTRFGLSLPVLLLFRFLYNRYEWYLQHPFELLSLIVGYNFLTAFSVAYLVQYNVWFTHEFMGWFDSVWLVTTKDSDEVLISWVTSLGVQLAWCFIYVVVKSSGRSQKSEIARIQVENKLKDAQINTLIGQISPHFLFNGMNNIITLMDEDVPRAQQSLRAFSDMLRSSLSSHAQERVTLEEELQLVNNYVAIAGIHLEDKLVFKQRVAPSARKLRVPPMILQMLVENAIKHGISRQKAGGCLNVVVDDSGEDLICLVSNDGVLGSSTDRKKRLDTGVGIQNIRQRLLLLYGDNARLDLVQEGKVVVAEVHIQRRLCE